MNDIRYRNNYGFLHGLNSVISRKYLGEEAQIDVTYVDEIPIEASGKRMVCVQKCQAYL